jgi:hypothetical protein
MLQTVTNALAFYAIELEKCFNDNDPKSTITRKDYTGLKKLVWDKHSSLFCPAVRDWLERFKTDIQKYLSVLP